MAAQEDEPVAADVELEVPRVEIVGRMGREQLGASDRVSPNSRKSGAGSCSLRSSAAAASGREHDCDDQPARGALHGKAFAGGGQRLLSAWTDGVVLVRCQISGERSFGLIALRVRAPR